MFLLSTLFIVVHSNIKLQVLKIHKDNILSAKFSSFKQYVCEIKLVYYTTISVYATSSFLKWLNFLTISDKYIIHSIYLSSWPAFLPVSVHLSPSLQNLFLHSWLCFVLWHPEFSQSYLFDLEFRNIHWSLLENIHWSKCFFSCIQYLSVS